MENSNVGKFLPVHLMFFHKELAYFKVKEGGLINFQLMRPLREI